VTFAKNVNESHHVISLTQVNMLTSFNTIH